jgi:hypothetical protein
VIGGVAIERLALDGVPVERADHVRALVEREVARLVERDRAVLDPSGRERVDALPLAVVPEGDAALARAVAERIVAAMKEGR